MGMDFFCGSMFVGTGHISLKTTKIDAPILFEEIRPRNGPKPPRAELLAATVPAHREILSAFLRIYFLALARLPRLHERRSIC
jgi:hypothetical protein